MDASNPCGNSVGVSQNGKCAQKTNKILINNTMWLSNVDVASPPTLRIASKFKAGYTPLETWRHGNKQELINSNNKARIRGFMGW